MVDPQLFFVQGTPGALRRIAQKYPGIRRLYARTDPLRCAEVIAVFAAVIARDDARARMESAWATAKITNDFQRVISLTSGYLGAGDEVSVQQLPQGALLPRKGVGFAFCPDAPMYTAAVLLDDMRVMKWCVRTCVPTFGLVKALGNTVLIHAVR